MNSPLQPSILRDFLKGAIFLCVASELFLLSAFILRNRWSFWDWFLPTENEAWMGILFPLVISIVAFISHSALKKPG